MKLAKVSSVFVRSLLFARRIVIAQQRYCDGPRSHLSAPELASLQVTP